MDIKNLSEFAGFCQDNGADETFNASLAFAGRLADLSEVLDRQYGGHGQGMDEWVGEAYTRLQADELATDQKTLAQTHEVLTRFWEHGDAFDKWLTSKVIVVQA